MNKIKIIFIVICCLVFVIIVKLEQSAIPTGGNIFSHKNIIESLQTLAYAIIGYVLYKYFNKKKEK